MSAIIKGVGKAVGSILGVQQPKPVAIQPPKPPAPAAPAQAAPAPEQTIKEPATPPSKTDAEVVTAGRGTLEQERLRRGRASTILTGPLGGTRTSGASATSSIGTKTLLGS